MIRHVGIVTNRLEDSIDFYKILGFNVVSDKMESGKHIDNFFGKENLSVRIVKMENDKDCIELLCFYDINAIPTKKSLMSLGLTHIAFRVTQITEDYINILKILGIETVCDLQITPTGHKVLFCRDPNGVFIELVEVP